jgi:hypothetical protein
VNQINQNAAKATVSVTRQRLSALRAPSDLSVEVNQADEAGRQALETSIAHRFEQQYKARIQHFLPYLLSLKEAGELDAVVGIRLASGAELFLERYLDAPVEQAISHVVRGPIDRGQVVEIGNLAAAVPGTASLLFAVLAIVLDRAGVRWVTCTATPQVKGMLDRLQFPTHTICNAEAAAMGDQAVEWGEYYASRPQVIVGDTRVAATVVMENPLVANLVRDLDAHINQVANTLRSGRPQ